MTRTARLLWTALAAGSLLLQGLFTAPSEAAAILDQEHVVTGSVGFLIVGRLSSQSRGIGQTFRVGQQGLLSRVELPMRADPDERDSFTVELWEGSLPRLGAEPLWSAPYNEVILPTGGYDVSSANLLVNPGERYAIAVRSPIALADSRSRINWGRPGYSGGWPISQLSNGAWSVVSTQFDLALRTYVEPIPEPNGLGLLMIGCFFASASRSPRS